MVLAVLARTDGERAEAVEHGVVEPLVSFGHAHRDPPVPPHHVSRGGPRLAGWPWAVMCSTDGGLLMPLAPLLLLFASQPRAGSSPEC